MVANLIDILDDEVSRIDSDLIYYQQKNNKRFKRIGLWILILLISNAITIEWCAHLSKEIKHKQIIIVAPEQFEQLQD